MECLNNFCIYGKDNECMLDEIELDVNGCCEECIYANIPTEVLEYEKERIRKRFVNED